MTNFRQLSESRKNKAPKNNTQAIPENNFTWVFLKRDSNSY